jgi:hypothetical protein
MHALEVGLGLVPLILLRFPAVSALPVCYLFHSAFEAFSCLLCTLSFLLGTLLCTLPLLLGTLPLLSDTLFLSFIVSLTLSFSVFSGPNELSLLKEKNNM